MDSGARNRLPHIKQKDWERLGYLDPMTVIDESEGLTNELDPIFHYTHPGQSLPTWSPLTKAEYEELLVHIRPILQLATLILRSPPSLNADYDLYYSPRVDPEKPIIHEGQPVLEFHSVKTLAEYWPHRSRVTNAALDRLAGVISFIVASEEQIPKLKGTNGFTKPHVQLHPHGVNIQDDTGVPKGIGSLILIHEKFVTDLKRLRNEAGVDNSFRIHSLTFKAAATMCHEIFHAKALAIDQTFLLDVLVELSNRNYAVKRKIRREDTDAASNEPLFEDNSDAELGHFWENIVFGGNIHYDNNVDNCLFFSKWPSWWTSIEHNRRLGYRKKMTKYIVPMHYISNVFRQDFWDKMKDDDLTALKIQKLVGMREPCPYPELIKSEWDSDDSEELYPLERVHIPRVCREKGEEVLEDPSKSKANETRQARLDEQRWA